MKFIYKHPTTFKIRILDWTSRSIFKVRLGPDFGPKNPNFNFLKKTGLFRTWLTPDSIPTYLLHTATLQNLPQSMTCPGPIKDTSVVVRKIQGSRIRSLDEMCSTPFTSCLNRRGISGLPSLHQLAKATTYKILTSLGKISTYQIGGLPLGRRTSYTRTCL